MEIDKKEIQEKYMKFQMLQHQMKDVVTQIEEISARLQDVDLIMQAVKETSEIDQGTEILVPISNGIFIKAETKENKNFLVNVGMNNVAVKDTSEVIKMLEKQKVELLNLQTELSKDAEKFEHKLISLQKEFEEINKDIKK